MKARKCRCGNTTNRMTCAPCMAIIKGKVKACSQNLLPAVDARAMPKYHTTSEAGVIGSIGRGQMKRNTQTISLKAITRRNTMSK